MYGLCSHLHECLGFLLPGFERIHSLDPYLCRLLVYRPYCFRRPHLLCFLLSFSFYISPYSFLTFCSFCRLMSQCASGRICKMIAIAISTFNLHMSINLSGPFVAPKYPTLMLAHFMKTSTNNTSWKAIVTPAYTFMTDAATCHINRAWPCFPVLLYFFHNVSKAQPRCAELSSFTFALNCDHNCFAKPRLSLVN